MDIDKLRRLNQMARDLKRHGISAGTEETAEQTEHIMDTNVPKQPLPDALSKEDVMHICQQLEQRCMQEFNTLKESVRVLHDGLQAVEQQLSSLKEEIASLAVEEVIEEPFPEPTPQEEMVIHQPETPEVVETPVVQEPVEQPVAPAEPPQHIPDVPAEPSPPPPEEKKQETDYKRNPEDFKEDEVSVENIFYSGNT